MSNSQVKDDSSASKSDSTVSSPDGSSTNSSQEATFSTIFSNGLILVVSSMLATAGLIPNTQLQSSINIEGGLGTKTASVGKAASILSFLVLPNLVMQKLGLKVALFLAISLHSVSFLANYYPTWYVLLVGSIFQGLTGGLGLVCIKTCVISLSERYAELRGVPSSTYTGWAFAIFYTTNSVASVVGNLVSYEVLRKPRVYPSSNVSSLDCGINFCYTDYKQNKNFQRPDDLDIYVLFGIFAGAGVLASVIIVVFLNNNILKPIGGSTLSLLMDSLKMYKEKYILLLVPLGLYRGLAISFQANEFNTAYVTCTLGEEYIGLMHIGQSVSHTFLTFLFGLLARYTCRPLLCGLASLNKLCYMVILIFWTPNIDHLPLFFTVGAVAELSASIWETQSAVLYITLFPERKAYAIASLMLPEALGAMIGNAYSTALCVKYKICVVMVACVVAFSCYALVEALRSKEKIKSMQNVKVAVEIEKPPRRVRFTIAETHPFNLYPFEISL